MDRTGEGLNGQTTRPLVPAEIEPGLITPPVLLLPKTTTLVRKIPQLPAEMVPPLLIPPANVPLGLPTSPDAEVARGDDAGVADAAAHAGISEEAEAADNDNSWAEP